MRKIPRRYAGIVMGAMMAIVMGFLMSFVVTLLNLGFVEGFFRKWMVAFFGALPIGFPIALFVTPVIKAFIDRISE
jgi:hypothetical protein